MLLEKKRGFVALITAIILSVILIVVTVTLNRSGFFARGAILEAEFKETSSALAEACVDTALLRLAVIRTFTGSDTEDVGAETCTFTVSPPNIDTTATYRDSITNLHVIYNPADLSIVSWEEI